MMEEEDREHDEESIASSSSFNRNPQGKNQYRECPPKTDPELQRLLREFDRRGVTNRNKLSDLLKGMHRIKISPASVARCRQYIGLKGSGQTTRNMPDVEKRQLVLDQMAKDPTRRRGPRLVKAEIARATGVHLTREYVEMEMRLQDPDGFAIRDPFTERIN